MYRTSVCRCNSVFISYKVEKDRNLQVCKRYVHKHTITLCKNDDINYVIVNRKSCVITILNTFTFVSNNMEYD